MIEFLNTVEGGAVVELLQSKKFIVALLASLVVFAAMIYGLSLEEALAIAGPLMSFVLGQGIADAGKERAKVEQQTAIKSNPPQK